MGDAVSEASALIEKADSSAGELIKLIEKLIDKATEDHTSEAEKIAKRLRELDALIEGQTKAIEALDGEIDKLEDEIEEFDALPEGAEKKAKKKAAQRLRRRIEEREADREAAKRAKEALQKDKLKLIEKLGD